jgi:hypothetical protein
MNTSKVIKGEAASSVTRAGEGRLLGVQMMETERAALYAGRPGGRHKTRTQLARST